MFCKPIKELLVLLCGLFFLGAPARTALAMDWSMRSEVEEIGTGYVPSADELVSWGLERMILTDPGQASSFDGSCSRSELARLLYGLYGGFAAQTEGVGEAAALSFAKGRGLFDSLADPGENVTHDEVLNDIWILEDGGFDPLYAMDDEPHTPLEWALEEHLIMPSERELYNGLSLISELDVLKYLYYLYHYRRSFPITVEEFLLACRNVCETARINHYPYGCSMAADPTSDGVISCDRLIAKALYDLGYTDQIVGGETCGTLDAYLSSHGFLRSSSWQDVKKGSILLVHHEGVPYIDHTFVCASDFNFEAMVCDRYDCGSQEYIWSLQPIRDVGFWYSSDIIVYNIPAG